MGKIVELKEITKAYGERKVLDNISLDITEGQMIAIMGRSGAGKTTLLNILGCLDKPDSGIYKFKDKEVNLKRDSEVANLRKDSIGFVIQNYALINQKNAYYNISVPLLCKGLSKKNIRNLVEDIAKKVGIYDLLDKHPYELSGGECQRVSIARALVRNPDIILADEPTGALDEATEKDILSIFQELNKQGITILIVTHNPEVAKVCSTLYKISDGKLSAESPESPKLSSTESNGENNEN